MPAAFGQGIRGQGTIAIKTYSTVLLAALAIAGAPAKAGSAKFEISPDLPVDIEGGAVDADISRAAIFAWQEFIALNWPALSADGQTALRRDTPDRQRPFGDPGYQGPLVWHTYRHKSEILPGSGDPAGYDPTSPDYGYDALPPVYTYAPDVGDNGDIPACPGQQVPVNGPALINLDETSQIGLDYMFAGAAPTDIDSDINSFPQLIRFLAQGNGTYYQYLVRPDAVEPDGDPLYTHPQPCPSTPGAPGYDHTYCEARRNFTAVAQGNGSPSSLPGFAVDFPVGTVLVKGAFRELTQAEQASGRFYATTVRYYENPNGVTDLKQQCYRERQWGLVSLHIIHKTPTSPNFVFATFEQADNLLTANGKRIEKPDGRFRRNGGEPRSTTPRLFYEDGALAHLTIAGNPLDPADYCEAPGSRLYYLENPAQAPLPTAGPICQNFRDHTIPAPIRAVNRLAQKAVAKYSKKRKLGKSPWQYYRLVNVQAEPFDKTEIAAFNGPANRAPEIFYLANIMVETDYSLQHFSGRLADGLKTDLPANFDLFNGRRTSQNVLTLSTSGDLLGTANMGGCMGCHGVAQLGGNDFSFVLGEGRVSEPEVPGITPPGVSNPAPGTAYYRQLHGDSPPPLH